MRVSRQVIVWTAVGAVAVAALLLSGCPEKSQVKQDEGYSTSAGNVDKSKLPLLVVQPFFAKHLSEDTCAGLMGRFTEVLDKQTAAYRVMSTSEIGAIMQNAESRTLFGTCMEGDCLSQISSQLNAKLIVQVVISPVGERTLLQVNVVDGPAATILKRVSRELDSSNVEAVLDEMRPLAGKTAQEL
jgi:hypothetical protein